MIVVSSSFTIDYPHPYNKIGDGPEGPEVRTVADKLRPVITGHNIISVYKGPRAEFIGDHNIVCPMRIIHVRSHGKKLIIDLPGHMMVISLGMTGRLQYTEGHHSHVAFTLDTGTRLYFDDYRYMGSVDVIPHHAVAFYFGDLGPDLLQLALDDNTWIPLPHWLSIFKKPSRKIIYKVLKDQTLVAGIGNYLVCEILYYARISPLRTVASLNDSEWDQIRISAHAVIRLSYAYNGLTIESFISPDGTLGTYPRVVYGQERDPYGNMVEKISFDQTAHWVPVLQK
jgi:formamidopyrimidine-DNA glycosylase